MMALALQGTFWYILIGGSAQDIGPDTRMDVDSCRRNAQVSGLITSFSNASSHPRQLLDQAKSSMQRQWHVQPRPLAACPSRRTVPAPQPIPRNSDWGTLRSEIERLYVLERKKLRYIMRYMETKYGFKAT